MKTFILAFWILALGVPVVSAEHHKEDLLALNYHVMHPGEESAPADPNATFYLEGIYHLHYIVAHEWQGRRNFSFVRLTSPDMLHWTWQPTQLQPAFTGHGMFSGTGFITKEGRPAVIYNGYNANRSLRKNWITLAKDDQLSNWEKPYPVDYRKADGSVPEMTRFDPDCFRIGDTYYSISGGRDQPLFKSNDLKHWVYVGDFLQHDLTDVVLGEDIACANFFPLGDKWVLLCISHPYGARYYVGEWDTAAEQFVPESHHRMNWPTEGHNLQSPNFRTVFAPETVLTPDGRRVMWAWLRPNDALSGKSIQSLPRELSLAGDGRLGIRPLRELETLRFEGAVQRDVSLSIAPWPRGGVAFQRIAELEGDAYEIQVTMNRDEALRKRFGFRLFADKNHKGLAIYIQPASGTLRVGTVEAAFSVADLPEEEDLELRIFIDKYLVEIFANERQALVAAHMDWQDSRGFDVYAFGADTTFRRIDIWRLKPTNQGYLEARKSRIWEPDTE